MPWTPILPARAAYDRLSNTNGWEFVRAIESAKPATRVRRIGAAVANLRDPNS
jgi:methionine aminopeptidase